MSNDNASGVPLEQVARDLLAFEYAQTANYRAASDVRDRSNEAFHEPALRAISRALKSKQAQESATELVQAAVFAQRTVETVFADGVYADVTEEDVDQVRALRRYVESASIRTTPAPEPVGSVHVVGNRNAAYGLVRKEMEPLMQTAVPAEGEPDPALLVSMATCLNHGFGLLETSRQESILHDMRKLWDEVQGRGYYKPERRDYYMGMVDTARLAKAEGDAQDAARYRWLRDRNGAQDDGVPVEIFIDEEAYSPGFLDAQVDAAMGAARTVSRGDDNG